MSRWWKPRRGALVMIAVLFSAGAAVRLMGHADVIARAAFASDGEAASDDLCTPQPAIAELLADLKARGDELDAREETLTGRAAEIAVAEEELAVSLQRLTEAEQALQDTIAAADGAMESDVDRLVRVYEAMKPAEAAGLFEAMEVSFAAGFLARMNAESAAAIMSGLPPEMAYAVSLSLAGRNAGVPTE
ncbi:hypothetical protein RM543_03190 [Roseicyclus sp. F158]|uniref:Flagellar motility protein MotE, a chaperone for MotC folding n=1 Tax=Tropicimonas omnivorans TaxID=3075590 RepID=A0ABU3DDA6_9RHOB|nr:hypothetical protein [Roseicyclus sp. F158]MDT0681677.1 hypothetical protein [Roseicyclus sp. F158]